MRTENEKESDNVVMNDITTNNNPNNSQPMEKEKKAETRSTETPDTTATVSKNENVNQSLTDEEQSNMETKDGEVVASTNKFHDESENEMKKEKQQRIESTSNARSSSSTTPTTVSIAADRFKPQITNPIDVRSEEPMLNKLIRLTHVVSVGNLPVRFDQIKLKNLVSAFGKTKSGGSPAAVIRNLL